jgi:hypothetical protein
MKLEQEQEERRRQKDESEREERQRREDRQFMANMMTLQMNLMCGSSNYATDQPLYPATQSDICEIHGDVFDDDWLEGVDHEGENVNREQNDENTDGKTIRPAITNWLKEN